MKRLIYLITSLTLPFIVLSACSQELPTEERVDAGPTGSIVVGLTITGTAVDGDGCGVRLDDTRCGRIQAGEELLLRRVSTGMHTVTLHGLDVSCNVAGGAERTLGLDEGETEYVRFHANCEPPSKPEDCREVDGLTGRCGFDS